MGCGSGPGSDGGGDPEAAHVLLLGAGRQGVVEGAEFLVHRRVEIVEDLLPAGRLVVAAGQQQLPRLRLPVALAALGQELRQVGVLRGRLLRRASRPEAAPAGSPPLRTPTMAATTSGRTSLGLAHVLPPPRGPPDAGHFPGGRMPNHLREGCRTRRGPSPRGGVAAASSSGAARYDRRALEDSPSGLWRSLGKRVGGNPSGVRISHPPQVEPRDGGEHEQAPGERARGRAARRGTPSPARSRSAARAA